MSLTTHRRLRLLLILTVVVTLCTVGSGTYKSIFAGSSEAYRGLKLFSEVLEMIEKNYVDPVEAQEVVIKAIHGMVNSLDPHSAFLPPEAFTELRMDTKGTFGGIGIVITMKENIITVISPIQGTPAYEAGIKAGDRIIKVDGQSTENMMLWEAVKKMRGPQGTDVVITVAREGATGPIDFRLTRDIIPIESVKAISLKPSYGYIWITNFNENTADDLKEALSLLNAEEPLKGLILDLRDNPGGLLNQAVDVSDLFLRDGPIVSIKGRHKRHTKVYKASEDKGELDFSMAVLINGGSASASEIVAGALKDNKRALVLGTTSFGKGSVQTVESLRDGYGLKFTIARYYTPSGRSIQAQGVEPDIVIPPGKVDPAAEEEPNLLKEKDLKNHLEAEPMDDEADADDADEAEADEAGSGMGQQRLQRVKSRHSPLELERLRSDRQVMRALEILVSHDILAGR